MRNDNEPGIARAVYERQLRGQPLPLPLHQAVDLGVDPGVRVEHEEGGRALDEERVPADGGAVARLGQEGLARREPVDVLVVVERERPDLRAGLVVPARKKMKRR